MRPCKSSGAISKIANAVAVVLGERGSAKSAAFWFPLTGDGMGRGATEEAGDSLERLTEAEDMWDEWVMSRWFVTRLLLSLHRGFSGGIPELVVVHAPAWPVPKCCHFQGILSTSGGIGAVDVAHDVSGCGWTPLHTPQCPQSDQGVVKNSLVRAW